MERFLRFMGEGGGSKNQRQQKNTHRHLKMGKTGRKRKPGKPLKNGKGEGLPLFFFFFFFFFFQGDPSAESLAAAELCLQNYIIFWRIKGCKSYV
jgi:hypothetical protein